MSFQVPHQKSFLLTFSYFFFFFFWWLFSELGSAFPYTFKNADIRTKWILPAPAWPMPRTSIYLVRHTYYYPWHSWSSTVMGTLIHLPISYNPWSFRLKFSILSAWLWFFVPWWIIVPLAMSGWICWISWFTTLCCTTYHNLTLFMLSANIIKRWFYASSQITNEHTADNPRLKIKTEFWSAYFRIV